MTKTMKAIFVSYNQAYYREIIEIFTDHEVRGYTRWMDIEGRGSVDGEPHEGSHAWPTMNDALLVFVEDGKVPELLDALRAKDESAPELGLRAFSWTIDGQ